MTYLMYRVHKHIRGVQAIDKVYDFGFALSFDLCLITILAIGLKGL